MTRFSLVALLSIALLTGAAPGQQEYKSESGSWRFTAPAAWNPIGFDIIKAGDAQERAQFPDKSYAYIAGFTTGPMNTRTYPYILINKTDVDLSNVRFEDLDEALSLNLVEGPRGEALLGLAANFTAEPGSLDRSRLRVTGWYDSTDENGKEYHVTIYSFLGAKQSIEFECYDLKNRGTQNVAIFREFVDSFAMRDDLKFVPSLSTSRFDEANFKPQRTASSSSSGRSFRYSGGGAVLVVVGIFLRIFLRSWMRG